jgi:Zn-dependent protease with chaperone function
MQTSVIPGILAGLSLLLLFTAIIYRLYPRWQARQLDLERLDATQLPDLVHDFHKLCMAAQLRGRPELWWNPLDGRMLALAFGTGSRPRIGLSGAMVLQHQRNPGAFAAIMLHELAHLRNGDVALTYLSMSVWWAYLITALLPSVLTLGALGIDWSGQFELFGIIGFATDVGLMTACVLFDAKRSTAGKRTVCRRAQQCLGGKRRGIEDSFA